MNTLRIVVEQTGPDEFRAVYVGHDRDKTAAAMAEETSNRRALFRHPPIEFNRPIATSATAATESQPVTKKKSK